MKRYLVVLSVALLPVSASAQDMVATIQKAAQGCASAIVSSDYEGVVRCTHKRVISLVGGEEAMIAVLKRGTKQFAEDKVAFIEAKVGVPGDPKTIGTWTISYIPQHIVMTVPGGRLYQNSTLLGVSEDQGKNWVFIDLGATTEEKLASVFPEFTGQVSMPRKNKPVFERD
jgi:hypothetical protein